MCFPIFEELENECSALSPPIKLIYKEGYGRQTNRQEEASNKSVGDSDEEEPSPTVKKSDLVILLPNTPAAATPTPTVAATPTQTVTATPEDTVEIIKYIESIAPLLKTEQNTAFFWSGRTNGIGGAERALEIAKMKKGITLEGLIEAQKIQMPEWDINDPVSIKAWEYASDLYASQVSGEVRAVVGSELRPGNVWENVELPRLKSNPNVTQITIIDPETLEEKLIFKR